MVFGANLGDSRYLHLRGVDLGQLEFAIFLEVRVHDIPFGVDHQRVPDTLQLTNLAVWCPHVLDRGKFLFILIIKRFGVR